MAIWIARNSDGAWMVKGFGDPSLINAQPANYTAVDVPGDACPHPRLERYDAAAPSKTRAATSAEQAAYDEAMADAAANSGRTNKDSLAVWATVAEAYNPNWATMTNAQRRAEVVRLAKRWEQQRNWVTRNAEFMVW